MTPDRIWADPPEIFDGCDMWRSWPNERGTEYIRADLIPAMIAEAVTKEREAIAQMADEKATGYEGENNEAAWACSKPVAVRLRGLATAIRNRKDTLPAP